MKEELVDLWYKYCGELEEFFRHKYDRKTPEPTFAGFIDYLSNGFIDGDMY